MFVCDNLSVLYRLSWPLGTHITRALVNSLMYYKRLFSSKAFATECAFKGTLIHLSGFVTAQIFLLWPLFPRTCTFIAIAVDTRGESYIVHTAGVLSIVVIKS